MVEVGLGQAGRLGSDSWAHHCDLVDWYEGLDSRLWRGGGTIDGRGAVWVGEWIMMVGRIGGARMIIG